MKLESKKYLSDIEYSISLIEQFLEGYSFIEYQKDLKTKSAVERQLGIVGEAVNKFKKTENIELSESREIIAFRNRLIHAYNNLEDEISRAVINQHIPKLKKEIIGLLSGD